MKLQDFINSLQEKVNHGTLDPELEVAAFDGSGQYSPITEESVRVLDADSDGVAFKLLCLNADQLETPDEDESGEVDLVTAVNSTRLFLHSVVNVISATQPEVEELRVRSMLGLVKFNAQKTKVLELAYQMDHELEVLLVLMEVELFGGNCPCGECRSNEELYDKIPTKPVEEAIKAYAENVKGNDAPEGDLQEDLNQPGTIVKE